MATTDALLKIKQARAWLMREYIWIGALSLKLDPQPSDNPNCTYLATDGQRLLYNAKRILAEPVDKLAGVIAHECGHCALGHFARLGDRDPKLFNIACDHAVNHLLNDAGIALPDSKLMDPAYHGWTAERIYLDLQQNGKYNGKNPDPKNAAGDGQVQAPDADQEGTGDQDADQPGQTPGQAKANELAKEWQTAAAEAEQIATMRGKMPAALKKALEAGRNPPQDWRAILRQFATDPAKINYGWTPPNRRHIWRGAYLPKMTGEEVGTLALFLDTSGSVWHRVPEFVEEGKAILESGIIGELVLIACDARAHLVGQFRRGEHIELTTIPGGGGTNFAPPFEMLAEMGITPTCAAYITDLEGSFPSDPGYPTLWIATQPGTAPFGTVIDML